ncbi:hypothetical protein M1O29_02415 [Dehalococcoidia bacterium]|nr:hypothetical protein [Dehalococcoidia bacterium]
MKHLLVALTLAVTMVLAGCAKETGPVETGQPIGEGSPSSTDNIPIKPTVVTGQVTPEVPPSLSPNTPGKPTVVTGQVTPEVPPSLSPNTPVKPTVVTGQVTPEVPPTSSRDTSVLSRRARTEFVRNLPELNHFANNKSDRFIVDFEDVIAAHPYPGQRSPVPHNDAQVYFSNTDERWQNAKHPSDYPPIYAVADGIITGVDSFSLNDHTNYDPPWWHVKYGLAITFAREGDTAINFIYAIEPYINLENKPDDFYEQFILVKRGQVVKKGDVLAYMYVPSLEEKVGPNASTHIAFALARQGQGNWDMYAPAIFSEGIVEQFGNLWQNPKEGWESTSYGTDWARAKGVPVGMGWMIGASENPFGDWPLDVIAYDGIRDLELDGQARLYATDIGFAKDDLIKHFAGNGDYVSKEFDISTEWQMMVAIIGGSGSVSVAFDGREMSLANNGPEAGYLQIISGVMSPGRMSVTVRDPFGWGWAIAIAPVGSAYIIPGENNPDPRCPPGCPPLPSRR